jgi:DNA-binding response OmpR family regulator
MPRPNTFQLTLPDARIDLVSRWVARNDGTRTRLAPIERDLLTFLLARAGQRVTRDQLLEGVWGYAPTVVSRACDTAVHRLRTKIEADPAEPRTLTTVFGSGYLLSLASADELEPLPLPQPRPPERRIRLGGRVVDLGRALVVVGGRSLPLSTTEIGVLEALTAAGGHTVARDTLLRRVWGSVAGRPLHSTIFRLRRKLEPDPRVPEHLVTAADGYRLRVASEQACGTKRPTMEVS